MKAPLGVRSEVYGEIVGHRERASNRATVCRQIPWENYHHFGISWKQVSALE